MRLFTAVLAALLALVCGAVPGFAERRIALVVGNDRYPNLTDRDQLQKAVNDARAVGAAFRRLGFEVIDGENLTRQQFVDRLDQLVHRVSPGDVAAFYFSGHGVALEGMNYILPSDVPDLQSGQEIRLKGAAYAEQDIIAELQRRGVRLAVVVLDACRTNPFGRTGARAIGGEKGLGPPPVIQGVFSLYAASPGQAALDRLYDGDPDRNSVFTRVLVPAMTQPGVDLIEMAKQVQEKVANLARTVQHDQLPAYSDRVQGREYMAGPPSQTGGLNQTPPPGPAADEAAWDFVRDSKNPGMLRRFVDQYPTSRWRSDAVRRLDDLAKQEAAAARQRAAQEDWNSVERTTNIAALEAFQRRYPDTFQADLAGQRIAELRRQQLAVLELPKPQPQPQGFRCQDQLVSSWLGQHGAYGDRPFDPSIYDDQVSWTVNGRREKKSRWEITKDEEDWRKQYPVQRYSPTTLSVTTVGGQCVLSQQLDAYKVSKTGKESRNTYKVEFAIRADANGPRIVGQQIDTR